MHLGGYPQILKSSLFPLLAQKLFACLALRDACGFTSLDAGPPALAHNQTELSPPYLLLGTQQRWHHHHHHHDLERYRTHITHTYAYLTHRLAAPNALASPSLLLFTRTLHRTASHRRSSTFMAEVLSSRKHGLERSPLLVTTGDLDFGRSPGKPPSRILGNYTGPASSAHGHRRCGQTGAAGLAPVFVWSTRVHSLFPYRSVLLRLFSL